MHIQAYSSGGWLSIIIHSTLTFAFFSSCSILSPVLTGGFMKRAIQGTLEYMAPEVLLKKPASSASDVYALAIAISELATGALTVFTALIRHAS
jgi:serine/threonine protein kinase